MRILNFGSLNIDYVYQMDYFVRPGETQLSQELSILCGGKGLNQSVALARAGAKVCHAGKIGMQGEILLERLVKDGVDISRITRWRGATGHAIIQVDKQGQNCIILYGGANQAILQEEVDTALKDFGEGDLLLVQNEINNLTYIMQQAKRKGMKIVLNPSPINKSLLECPLELVDIFILNEIEGSEISGKYETEKICTAMASKYGNAEVVLTQGKKGVIYFNGEKTVSHGIYKVKVVDTTAAGDTFTGYYLAGIMEQLPVEAALQKASIASSIAVSRPGAADSIPTRGEVEAAELELE